MRSIRSSIRGQGSLAAVQVWIGLALSLVSALAVNWAYTREHDAANELPPLSAKHPLESARALVSSRAWLVGFGAETGGWLVYLAALRLAPLALVQTVGASGIAVLALIQTRGRLDRLGRREQVATGVAVAGLVLLGLSLTGEPSVGREPNWVAAAVWLGATVGGAAVLTLARIRLDRAVAFGLAAGLLFASGDISAKLVVYGGWWLLLVAVLIAGYAFGSIELQSAFQHSDALTAAGMATLTTNALPIAAGVVLFREELPPGIRGAAQVAAFATLVASAVLLADRRVKA
jgi:hypothetical protein